MPGRCQVLKRATSPTPDGVRFADTRNWLLLAHLQLHLPFAPTYDLWLDGNDLSDGGLSGS